MAMSGEGMSVADVELVQLEGLVALKIIKHCEEVSDNNALDVVQGALLGLVVDRRLEITNCFPMPRSTSNEEYEDLRHQMEMMRNLRNVNVDHLHVGWYQSTFYGAFLTKTLLDSQFGYQSDIAESVALIYDPTKTARDELSLRAFRLSEELMTLRAREDFTIDSVKELGMSYETMFEEIPVIIKNSHLMNVALCEIEQSLEKDKTYNNLDMATGNVMENYLRLLMDSVDDLTQDTNKFIMYQKNMNKALSIKNNQLAKRHAENELRKSQGQPPIHDDDIHKNFKLPPPANRLDGLLLSSQVENLSQELSQFATQSFGKLFMAESLGTDQQ